MKCPQCSVEVAPEAGFCHRCGAPLNAAAAPTLAPGPAAMAAAAGRTDIVETDVWTGSWSPKAMIGTWITIGILSLAAIAAAVIFPLPPVIIGVPAGIVAVLVLAGLYVMYRRASVSYRLTNHRFFHERGILKRVTDRIEVIDIDDVTVEQGFVERMMGVGTIRVTSSDRTDPELRLPAIDNVRVVAEKMDDLRRQERMRRGLHIEAV